MNVELALPVSTDFEQAKAWQERIDGIILLANTEEKVRLRMDRRTWFVVLEVAPARLPEVASDLANEGFLE